MNKKQELLKNTGIISIGKISSQLVTFLLLPLYTTILSTEEYGTVDLILSYIQLLLPIVNLQLDQALFRFLVTKRSDKNEIKTIISTMGFFSVLQLVCYTAIFLIAQIFIHNEYKWFFLLNIIFSVYASFISNCSRGLGDNVKYSFQSFIGVTANLLLNILFLVGLKIGANGMLLASGLSGLVSGTYGLFASRIYKYLSLHSVDKSRIRNYYSYSIPLIPNQLSWWVMKASDKTIINIFVSLAANGIIAVASKFSSAYIMVYNLFNLAWAESVVLHIDDNDGQEYLEETINSMFALFSSLCFGIIVCMPVAYPLLVNSSYMDGYNLVPIYMISVLFNVVVGLYSAIYVARQDTKAVAATSGIAALINIIVDLMLVKFIGVYAAPVSSVAGFGVVMVYRYFQSRKYIVVKLKKQLLVLTFATGCTVLILYYMNHTITNLLSFVICIIYAFLVNKKTIKSIFIMLKRKIK